MSKRTGKELMNYFDSKFDSLRRELKHHDGKRKRRESDFKYDSNRVQNDFNNNLKEDLQDVLDLIEVGSQKRTTDLVKKVIKDIEYRNKLIRMADKSPGGWATVKEYESDSLADDSEDDRKIRAAEKRALQKQSKKRRPNYPPSSTLSSGSQQHVRSVIQLPRFKQKQPSQDLRSGIGKNPKSTDVCLLCSGVGHWKRDCPSKIKEEQ